MATVASQSTRSTEDLIRKSLHAGHVYQLTHNREETESSLRNWFENFLSLFEVEEQTFIQKVQFLWRKGDILKAQAMLQFPANREQLATLFKHNRLAKDMFDPPLTDAELNVITDTNGAALDYAIKAEGTTPVCATCRKDCVGTCAGHRTVFNRVMSHITMGLYKTAPEAFNDAINVRKALSKFQNTAKRFILPELADAFTNGKYINWTNLTNSIRRAFNVKEEKRTLSNLFTRIHTAATKSVNMENRIDSLADLAREIAITDEKDFFRPRDFEGDMSQTMSQPEQVGPLVHTLLEYIVLRETVPMAKWEQVQTDFERKIQSGWSYRSWHENRPQLYEIVDMSKTSGKIAAVGIHKTDANRREGDADSELNYEEGRHGTNVEETFPSYDRRHQRAINNHRGERHHGQQPLTQEDRRRANNRAQRIRTNLCLNCSHYHPNKLTVYHPEGSGFGGTGKYCLYDAKGKERNDSMGRNINAIRGELYSIEADGNYPIMADIEMFDQIKDNDMKTTWGFDLLRPQED